MWVDAANRMAMFAANSSMVITSSLLVSTPLPLSRRPPHSSFSSLPLPLRSLRVSENCAISLARSLDELEPLDVFVELEDGGLEEDGLLDVVL